MEEQLSDYERDALGRLKAQLERRQAKPTGLRRSRQKAAQRLSSRGAETWSRVPFSDRVEEALTSAMGGLKAITMDPALRSIRVARVTDDYQQHGFEIAGLDDIRSLDLSAVDETSPGLKSIYSWISAAEGGIASLAITGGEVFAVLGSVAGAGAGAAPGAGAVIGAMAADSAATMAASARLVAHTAAYYGYDVRRPEEEMYALMAMNFSFSSAGSQASKATAFRQLSVVTQQIARNKAWSELNEATLVRTIQAVFKMLGFRLTKRKLGQAIPLLGVAIGAGLNGGLMHHMGTDAEMAYRVRFLADKCGVPPEDLLPTVSLSDEDDSAGGRFESIDLDEVTKAVLADT